MPVSASGNASRTVGAMERHGIRHLTRHDQRPVEAAATVGSAAGGLGALMRAGQGVMAVVPGDGLTYLRVATGRPPFWVRPVQLLLRWVGALLGLLRARPAAGLLLGLAARAVLEPNPAPAYSISQVRSRCSSTPAVRVPLASPCHTRCLGTRS